MSFGAPPRPSGVGLLTRTILQIEGVLSVASIAQVTRALQRVPGVLLAEVNSGSARATVAHDDAVTAASLLAAAGGAGVRAKIVPDPATAAPGGGAASPQRPAWSEWLPIVVTALFAALALSAILFPDVAFKHWLVPAMMASLGLALLARSIVRRPRT
jgi:Cu+-exporting ATPase